MKHIDCFEKTMYSHYENRDVFKQPLCIAFTGFCYLTCASCKQFVLFSTVFYNTLNIFY